MFGAMLVFGVLVRSRTQVRSLSRCASVGALHASAVLCVGGLPPSDYGIHATSTATNTTLICNWAVHSAVNLLNLLYGGCVRILNRSWNRCFRNLPAGTCHCDSESGPARYQMP